MCVCVVWYDHIFQSLQITPLFFEAFVLLEWTLPAPSVRREHSAYHSALACSCDRRNTMMSYNSRSFLVSHVFTFLYWHCLCHWRMQTSPCCCQNCCRRLWQCSSHWHLRGEWEKNKEKSSINKVLLAGNLWIEVWTIFVIGSTISEFTDLFVQTVPPEKRWVFFCDFCR